LRPMRHQPSVHCKPPGLETRRLGLELCAQVLQAGSVNVRPYYACRRGFPDHLAGRTSGQYTTSIGQVLTEAMRAVAKANSELRGMFTVDWNQPAPDDSGRPLIANEVVWVSTS